jgi:hypothetical protein
MKAGKRTYYFDVRTTKAEEYYLTITESRRQNGQDGSYQIKKHKIFLYKEDFQEFQESLQHVLDYIQKHQGEDNSLFKRAGKRAAEQQERAADEGPADDDFTQIEFEDL